MTTGAIKVSKVLLQYSNKFNFFWSFFTCNLKDLVTRVTKTLGDLV